MAHVDPVRLYKTPIVITMDVDAKLDVETSNWIKTNCMILTLDGPAYEE